MFIRVNNINTMCFVLLFISFSYSQNIGCMDDGYQQWSPNFGSPACNYDSTAIMEGECLYYDCIGDCGGSSIIDDCGICDGIEEYLIGSCYDCAGSPNGKAYTNIQCLHPCVGGTSEYKDCVNISIKSDEYLSNTDKNYFQIYANNLDTLYSLDLKLVYNSNLINITNVNDYDTDIANYDFSTDYYNLSSSYLDTVNITTFFMPDISNNSDSIESFFKVGEVHLLNIEFSVLNPLYDRLVEIEILSASINEHNLYKENFIDGYLILNHTGGCLDEEMCNFNPNALFNDGTCAIGNFICSNGSIGCNACGDCIDILDEDNCIQDCSGIWGGSAYLDGCGQCISDIDHVDCFGANFKVFDETGIEIQDSIPNLTDKVYFSVYMENLPLDLDGLNLEIKFDPKILLINKSSISSINIDSSLIINSLFDSMITSNDSSLVAIGELINDSTWSTIIYNINNNSLVDVSGNILFLELSQRNIQDSTLLGLTTIIEFNSIQVNENIMPKTNFKTLEFKIVDLLSNNNNFISNSYYLKQNYPNPFNPLTTIEYFIPEFNTISIYIINLRGQVVRNLVDEFMSPGIHQVIWDGTNNYGYSLPAGIYFSKMDVDNFSSTQKLILLK